MTTRGWLSVALLAIAGCATDGTSTGVGVGFYGDWYYQDDVWYGGGCCVNPPDAVGPPHVENPIVIPPGSQPRPENPIALPPTTAAPKASQPMSAAPRPAAMPRGGGGGRGGGGRR